ncbi:hypothetical protein DL93DRAFT_2157117 [Clavulina sp. PMI_390]|nr:hypothetical protein DL93DRAFT_2157117 [Clavulina sp. PMI_390]
MSSQPETSISASAKKSKICFRAALLSRYDPISSTLEEADWEALQNDPNVELWAMKAKSLNDLELAIPPIASSSSTSSFTKKGTSYTVTVSSSGSQNGDERHSAAEMQSLTCLLSSSSRNGQLYAAPKPFSRYVLVSEAPPTVDPSPAESTSDPSSNGSLAGGLRSKRPTQPTHLLNHKFAPIGSSNEPIVMQEVLNTTADIAMDVDDQPQDSPERPAKKVKRKHAEGALEGRAGGDDEAEDGEKKKEKKKKEKRSKEVA